MPFSRALRALCACVCIGVPIAGSAACHDRTGGRAASAAPTLLLTTPTANDFVAAEQDVRITWTATGLSGNVTLTFSTDGGATFAPVAPIDTALASAGELVWSPPSGLASARLRIEGGGLTDELTADFAFVDVVFVDVDATGVPDGLTWETALARVQTALAQAQAGDHVWVTANTTTTAFQSFDDAALFVPSGATLVGGFAGGESAASQRPAGSRALVDGEGTRPCVLIDSGAGSLITFDGFRFANGQAEAGAAISSTSAPLALTGCAFEECEATENGGALFLKSVDATLTRCTFTGNEADRGGAVFLTDTALEVTDCTFSSNEATQNDGGAIRSVDASLTISGATSFHSNLAATNGGAISQVEGIATITGATFTSNTADVSGGAYACEIGTFTIAGAVFEGNQAGGLGTDSFGRPFGGGALFAEGLSSASVVSASDFFANQSSMGGAVHVKTSISPVELENCVLVENAATGFGGGAFASAQGQLEMRFVSASANTATLSGGVLGVMADAFADVVSSVLFGNSAPEIGSVDAELSVEVNNSNVAQTLLGGDFNIDADPLFIDVAGRNLRIPLTSPNVDGGDPVGAPATDRDGVTRTGVPDIGAFEAQ